MGRSAAKQEARERVRAAVHVRVPGKNSGLFCAAPPEELQEDSRRAIRKSGARFPYNQRLIVNLAPGDRWELRTGSGRGWVEHKV